MISHFSRTGTFSLGCSSRSGGRKKKKKERYRREREKDNVRFAKNVVSRGERITEFLDGRQSEILFPKRESENEGGDQGSVCMTVSGANY